MKKAGSKTALPVPAKTTVIYPPPFPGKTAVLYLLHANHGCQKETRIQDSVGHLGLTLIVGVCSHLFVTGTVHSLQNDKPYLVDSYQQDGVRGFVLLKYHAFTSNVVLIAENSDKEQNVFRDHHFVSMSHAKNDVADCACPPPDCPVNSVVTPPLTNKGIARGQFFFFPPSDRALQGKGGSPQLSGAPHQSGVHYSYSGQEHVKPGAASVLMKKAGPH